MRGFVRFALLSLAAAACFAAPIATGTAAWQVSQTSGTLNNGVALNTVSSAVVLTGTLPSVWVAPPSGSAWVGQAATDGNEGSGQCGTISGGTSCGAQAGTYVYTLSFVNALGGVLTGFQYTADNSVTITITDSTGTIYTNASGANAHTALINGPASLNWLGNLTITATVTNSQLAAPYSSLPTPSGFLAAGDVSLNTDGVPEPSTYAMLGLGGAAMLVARLRRRK